MHMRYVLVLLTALGIVVSAFALWEHYRTDTSLCSSNDKWDRGILNHGPYARCCGKYLKRRECRKRCEPDSCKSFVSPLPAPPHEACQNHIFWERQGGEDAFAPASPCVAWSRWPGPLALLCSAMWKFLHVDKSYLLGAEFAR